eukprot:TRINITY_DN7020_c0_g2_i1.p2 TRINITY_DN7020_c0_g2~~TRINITY_DN7020_c0_g2_i1.p2  ORF type:complete len:194 (+),score=37.50 TRINITY_DN7020_c0_g2_i1:354-935(+)
MLQHRLWLKQTGGQCKPDVVSTSVLGTRVIVYIRTRSSISFVWISETEEAACSCSWTEWAHSNSLYRWVNARLRATESDMSLVESDVAFRALWILNNQGQVTWSRRFVSVEAKVRRKENALAERERTRKKKERVEEIEQEEEQEREEEGQGQDELVGDGDAQGSGLSVVLGKEEEQEQEEVDTKGYVLCNCGR